MFQLFGDDMNAIPDETKEDLDRQIRLGEGCHPELRESLDKSFINDGLRSLGK